MADLRISDLTAHTTGILAAADLVEVSQESGGTFTSRKMTGAQLKATTNNFANADLTFTANRSHDTDGYNLTITTDAGVGAESLIGMSTTTARLLYNSKGIFVRANGIELSGAVAYSINAITTTYTIDDTDNIINCTSGTFTVTLPTAVNADGRQYIIKNSGAGTITLEGDGTETIDGALNVTLATKKCYTVVSDGANWIITNLF